MSNDRPIVAWEQRLQALEKKAVKANDQLTVLIPRVTGIEQEINNLKIIIKRLVILTNIIQKKEGITDEDIKRELDKLNTDKRTFKRDHL